MKAVCVLVGLFFPLLIFILLCFSVPVPANRDDDPNLIKLDMQGSACVFPTSVLDEHKTAAESRGKERLKPAQWSSLKACQGLRNICARFNNRAVIRICD